MSSSRTFCDVFMYRPYPLAEVRPRWEATLKRSSLMVVDEDTSNSCQQTHSQSTQRFSSPDNCILSCFMLIEHVVGCRFNTHKHKTQTSKPDMQRETRMDSNQTEDKLESVGKRLIVFIEFTKATCLTALVSFGKWIL